MQIDCNFYRKFTDCHYNSIQLSFSDLPSALKESIVADPFKFPSLGSIEIYPSAQL